MATTRDLVNEYIDIEMELEHAEIASENTLTKEELTEELVEVQTLLTKKVDGLDYYILELNRQENLIDAEIRTLTNEVKRLRSRKNAITKTEDYFNKVLIPMIIKTMGEDGVLRTDTTKYKLYTSWGPIEVTDEDAVPNEYKRYKVEIDKKGVRKKLIEAAENNLGISGFKIERVERIRRS